MNELISVVLPVYNGEKYLEQSIDSILSQTYENWELLILDDCSNDNTPKICEDYVKKDGRIHYYRNKKNLKLPGNLNKGFTLANGDYLTWTSDDNIFKDFAFEKMLNVLRKNKDIDLVFASYQDIDEKNNKTQINYTDSTTERIMGGNIIGACFMYTRKAYNLTGEYDTNLFLVEDLDYWQRMLMHVKGKSIHEILYYYRVHSESLTSTKNDVEFGKRRESMIRKNIKGYNNLTITGKISYYSYLLESKKLQGKVDFENLIIKQKIIMYKVLRKIRSFI